MSGPATRDRQETGGRYTAPQQQPPNRMPLYLGIGGGAVVLIIIIAVAASGGGPEGPSPETEARLGRILAKAEAARGAGNYEEALKLLSDVVGNDEYSACAKYKTCKALAEALKKTIAREREAAGKVADFKRRYKAALEEGFTARSKELLDECNELMGNYGTTAAIGEIQGERETLLRSANEQKGEAWKEQYNPAKDRIDRDFLKMEDFAGAIKAWTEFGAKFDDSSLLTRINAETIHVDGLARDAAKKLVSQPGVTRADLERARPRFEGTGGLGIIEEKLKGM